ncbi:MAG: helix-turn-helix transcriptional regulator [Oscillibacter sp.]|jgi:transcriptional regulator with XRE-family HTH domain|nr:helix-turn-helix transcriptional regulator [Oscillibacter sp.]
MNRIALLRKERKLNQKEFGTIIGVAQNTICNWENENREPDHESLKKMADFFDCSIDYLLGYIDQKTPTPVDGSGPRAYGHKLLDEIPLEKIPEALQFLEFIKATSGKE